MAAPVRGRRCGHLARSCRVRRWLPAAQGKAVITEHLDDLDAAEARVNEIYFAWRSGTPTPLDDELNTMLARWRALTDGDVITLEWSRSQRANPGRRRARPGER